VTGSLLCLLLAVPLKAGEFTASLGEELGASLPFRATTVVYKAKKTVRTKKPPPPAPREPEPALRVGDPDSWRRLVEKAETKPHRRFTIENDGGRYEVWELSTSTPVAGQVCRGGSVRNTFFVTKPLDGADIAVYPTRLAAHCRVPTQTRDAVVVDADRDGVVLLSILQGGNFGIPERRVRKGPPTPDRRALEAFLAKLVELFLSLD
jgi:hypothetical protein